MLKRVLPDKCDEDDAGAACIARARQLAPLIEAHASETEAARSIAPAVLSALHEARLFRMLLPRSCDGFELEPADYLQAIEEIAKSDASTGVVHVAGLRLLDDRRLLAPPWRAMCSAIRAPSWRGARPTASRGRSRCTAATG